MGELSTTPLDASQDMRTDSYPLESHWKTLTHQEEDNNRCLLMTDWCFLHLRAMGCIKDKKKNECFLRVTLLWKHVAAGGLSSTARGPTPQNFLLLEVLSHCTKLFSRAWKCLLYSCTVGSWSKITSWISAGRKMKPPVIFNGNMSHQLTWIYINSEIHQVYIHTQTYIYIDR